MGKTFWGQISDTRNKGKKWKTGTSLNEGAANFYTKGKQLKEESTYRIEENICELYS